MQFGIHRRGKKQLLCEFWNWTYPSEMMNQTIEMHWSPRRQPGLTCHWITTTEWARVRATTSLQSPEALYTGDLTNTAHLSQQQYNPCLFMLSLRSLDNIIIVLEWGVFNGNCPKADVCWPSPCVPPPSAIQSKYIRAPCWSYGICFFCEPMQCSYLLSQSSLIACHFTPVIPSAWETFG